MEISCQFCKDIFKDISECQLHMVNDCPVINADDDENATPNDIVNTEGTKETDSCALLSNVGNLVDNSYVTDSVCLGNTNETIAEYSVLRTVLEDKIDDDHVALEDKSDNKSHFDDLSADEMDDSKVEILELMKTYEKIYQEKLDTERSLKNALESLNLCGVELAQRGEKLKTMSDDNQYLRTENTKLKNELKQIKENHAQLIDSDYEIEMQSINGSNGNKELNDLREDFNSFRFFMYREIDFIKGKINGDPARKTSCSSTDSSSVSSNDNHIWARSNVNQQANVSK